MLTKPAWRQEIKRRIATMSQRKRQEESAAVAAVLINFFQTKANNLKTVVLYEAMNDEVNLEALIGWLHSQHIVYLIPEYNRCNQTVQWQQWREGNKMLAEENTLGIADWWVVPARAVDGVGTRLGRGGGFYDRYLKNVQTDCIIVPLWSCQKVPLLPKEPHDIPVGKAVYGPNGLWSHFY